MTCKCDHCTAPDRLARAVELLRDLVREMEFVVDGHTIPSHVAARAFLSDLDEKEGGDAKT